METNNNAAIIEAPEVLLGGVTPPAGNETPGTLPPSDELPEWMKGIEDPEITTSNYLRGFKDPKEIYKAALRAKQTLSKKLIDIPGDDAPDDVKNDFYAKLGRPEKPDQYQFDLKVQGPDGKEVPFTLDEAKAQMYREVAFETGMSAKQLNTAMQKLLAKEQAMITAQGEEIRKEKGDKYGLYADTVNSVYKTLPPNLKTVFSQLPPKYASAILEHFGKAQVEDTIHKDGTPPSSTANLESVNARISELNKLNPIENSKELNGLYAQREQLMKQARRK